MLEAADAFHAVYTARVESVRSALRKRLGELEALDVRKKEREREVEVGEKGEAVVNPGSELFSLWNAQRRLDASMERAEGFRNALGLALAREKEIAESLVEAGVSFGDARKPNPSAL